MTFRTSRYVAAHHSYPQRAQGRAERHYIDCECGHRSWGDHFGAVWTGDPEDAWFQHRLHMDASCPDRRTAPGLPARGTVRDALREIRKILDRIDA